MDNYSLWYFDKLGNTQITIGTFRNEKTKIAINIFASFLSLQYFDINLSLQSF